MPYQVSVPNLSYVMNAIAVLVGYPPSTDPAGSTDPAVTQMRAAVNQCMYELLAMYEWQELIIKATMPMTADFEGQKEKAFTLPTDFYQFVDGTQWGKQTMLPAMGPITPQAWMQYIVRAFTPQLTLFWQRRENSLYVLNPPFGKTVDFEYMYLSRAQVVDADDASITKNVANKNGDTFKLDTLLITLLSRSKWLEWKGFDSSAARRDFLIAYNSRLGAGKGGAVLSISGPSGFPLIDGFLSVPDSGYGAT